MQTDPQARMENIENGVSSQHFNTGYNQTIRKVCYASY